MGANAQTTVPKYSALTVLPAASMNISAGTGIPVFATTVTRDAAFGGANKVLAQGQLCYLESTNVTQYYDGAAWATVGPAAAGALVRVGGGALSLSSTIFSGVFSATYDAYKITVSNLSYSGSAAIYLQLGATTTGYYSGAPYVDTAATLGSRLQNNAASWRFGGQSPSGMNAIDFELINPFLGGRTITQYSVMEINNLYGVATGYLDNTTSYTAFTFITSAGTFSTGTVNIYGYALS